MASNIGPRFALQVTAPAEWNRHLGDEEVVLKSESNAEAYIFKVYSKPFRERLLQGKSHWVFLAHILREDAEEFYAFEDPSERALFIELRELDSVGPKTAALAVAALGKKALSDLARGQPAATFKVPGLGPKTLEKIAQGLKSKAETFLPLLSDVQAQYVEGSAPRVALAGAPQVLVSSMEKLGLRPLDTLRIFQELLDEDSKVSELDNSELVRRVLQRWGQIRARSMELKA